MLAEYLKSVSDSRTKSELEKKIKEQKEMTEQENMIPHSKGKFWNSNDLT